jgi:hypothetical protein
MANEDNVFGLSLGSVIYSVFIILKIAHVNPFGQWPWVLLLIPLYILCGLFFILIFISCLSLLCFFTSDNNIPDVENPKINTETSLADKPK